MIITVFNQQYEQNDLCLMNMTGELVNPPPGFIINNQLSAQELA